MATGYTGQRPPGSGEGHGHPQRWRRRQRVFLQRSLGPCGRRRGSTLRVPSSSLKDDLGRGHLHTWRGPRGIMCSHGSGTGLVPN